MKILVIDDDKLIRKTFSHVLSQEGHKVETAKDGSAAGQYLVYQLPDLIICDLMMPHVSGVTFIKVLRDYLHYHIPVIIISSLDKGDTIATNLGIDNFAFMPKPIQFLDLINKINNYTKN